jgi:glycine/serine hydroxymethyltransferase
MLEPEMREIADLVHTMLSRFDDPAAREEVRARSLALCRRFPLPYRRAA